MLELAAPYASPATAAARAPSSAAGNEGIKTATGTHALSRLGEGSLLGGLLGLLALLLGLLSFSALRLDTVDLLDHEGASDPGKALGAGRLTSL